MPVLSDPVCELTDSNHATGPIRASIHLEPLPSKAPPGFTNSHGGSMLKEAVLFFSWGHAGQQTSGGGKQARSVASPSIVLKPSILLWSPSSSGPTWLGPGPGVTRERGSQGRIAGDWGIKIIEDDGCQEPISAGGGKRVCSTTRLSASRTFLGPQDVPPSRKKRRLHA